MTIGKNDLVAKLLKSGAEIQKAQNPTIKALGSAAKEGMMRAAVAAAGPDRMFSNLHKAKATLDVAVKIVATDTESEAVITARGPWGLSETRIDPHVIMTRLGAVQRKGVKRADYQKARRQRDLDIAYGARGLFSGLRPMGNRKTGFGPRYKVMHPGSAGRGNWAKGQADIYLLAQKELERRSLRAVRDVWT